MKHETIRIDCIDTVNRLNFKIHNFRSVGIIWNSYHRDIHIKGDSYQTYDQACINVNLNSLESRRIQMCLNFGLKCLNNNKHKTLFPRAPPSNTIGHLQPLAFKEPLCRTVRYEKSPVPYTLPNDWMLTSVKRNKIIHVWIVLYPWPCREVPYLNNQQYYLLLIICM